MSSVVIESHVIAAEYEVEESWEPHDSKSISVEVAYQVSVNKEFLESSVHEVEIELLVCR